MQIGLPQGRSRRIVPRPATRDAIGVPDHLDLSDGALICRVIVARGGVASPIKTRKNNDNDIDHDDVGVGAGSGESKGKNCKRRRRDYNTLAASELSSRTSSLDRCASWTCPYRRCSLPVYQLIMSPGGTIRQTPIDPRGRCTLAHTSTSLGGVRICTNAYWAGAGEGTAAMAAKEEEEEEDVPGVHFSGNCNKFETGLVDGRGEEIVNRRGGACQVEEFGV
ncbi:hypothetical protein ACHAW5_004138 [Stephanodiscus triporus]|uniref:Uncharacterized protein n=1 Tax=Stephanodiscus triporus TaxID=2934178 RepID=A0ABD3QGB1_9STRA